MREIENKADIAALILFILGFLAFIWGVISKTLLSLTLVLLIFWTIAILLYAKGHGRSKKFLAYMIILIVACLLIVALVALTTHPL